MAKDWKDRLGVVFSTDPEFQYEIDKEEEVETLPPEKQFLHLQTDSKHRKGKVVTLVNGFVGREDDLKALSKLLKTRCGTGGSAKGGVIIIQGERLKEIKEILTERGYKVK
ncbi:putative protein YciH [subsurface metagenome]